MWRAVIFYLLMVIGSTTAMAGNGPIRIGITPAILHDQYTVMMALRHYLEGKTGRVIDLVPRNSYRQTIDMVKRGELDFAWVSAFPYVYLQHYFRVRLVAIPVMDGQPTFRAYLIVPAEDKTTSSLLQLQGKIFAYADLYSHTGYVVPRHELRQAGKDPARFFARTFFTSGHKKVIRAVASGLADGGYVDSFVWDSLAVLQPALTARTRIVSRSPDYGGPPIVAAQKVSKSDFAAMRDALLGMAADPDGAKLLKDLNIDGFVAGDPKLYAEVERMMREMGDL
jgi:phosphonate transport system substrate-binding protein